MHQAWAQSLVRELDPTRTADGWEDFLEEVTLELSFNRCGGLGCGSGDKLVWPQRRRHSRDKSPEV